MSYNISRYFVTRILEKIKNAKDIDDVILNENKLACLFASPILFLLSILNVIIRYVFLKENIGNVLIDSIICIVFGVCFELILRSNLKLNAIVNLVASLYGAWCVFIFGRFGKILGPLMWYVAFIFLLLAMFQIRKKMLVVASSITTAVGIYSFFGVPIENFYFNKTYYIFFAIALSFTLIIAGVVHRNNMNRYKKLFQLLQIEMEQKKEIEDLYKKVTANEEELYLQNERLIQYNNMIKKSEEELHFLAYHDILTELPNRKLVYQKLDEMIRRAKARKTAVYVVYIDMDSFKNINDTLGHDAGDRFINSISRRVKSVLHEEDLIGRMGGDEFSLLIPRNISEEEVLTYLNVIKDKFEEIVPIDNLMIKSSASLGIAQYPRDGRDTQQLIKNADIAMYKSKELGKNIIQFYQPAMRVEKLKRLRETV